MRGGSIERSANRSLHFGVYLLHEKVLGPANAESRQIRIRRRNVIGGIVGHRLKRDGRIADRARQRPHMILRKTERQHAADVDSSESRLQTHDAAERRGHANRPSGIGAGGERHHAGGHSRSRSAARSAGNAREIPRVVDRSEVRIVGSDPVGQFVQSGLANRDRAGLVQLGDDGGIALRNIIREDLRPGRRAHAFGSHQIFVGDGNAVQRAAVDAAGEFLDRAASASAQRRLAGHGDKGVQFGIQPLDFAQRLRHQFPRRHLGAPADAAARL